MPTESSDKLALFTTKRKAQDYVKNSRLKNPRKGGWVVEYPFKKNSLLGDYKGCDKGIPGLPLICICEHALVQEIFHAERVIL